MRQFGAFIFGAALSAFGGYMFLGELIFNYEFNLGSFLVFLGFGLISFLGKRAHDNLGKDEK